MKSKDYYASLGITKTATETEIKKAYRKLAMQHHPDRTKGDKASEQKFKEITEAYETLSDTKKRKQYDTFGSAGDQFSGFSGGGSGGGFEDIFSQFGGANGRAGGSGFEFDLGDLFGGMNGGQQSRSRSQHQAPRPEPEKPSLDVEATKEVPILDFILGTKIDIETVYGKHLSLTIKAGTKPGTKFKLSGKGRSSDGQTGDMYIKAEAKMPKEVPDDVIKVLEALKYRL